MVARPILISSFIAAGAFTADASPRTDPTAGRAVFTGATMQDASSIALNPAALGRERSGTEIFGVIASMAQQITIDRKQVDPADGSLAPAESVDDRKYGVGGAFGVILHPSGGRYAVSFELRTPPDVVLQRAPDPLRYHTLEIEERNYIATIASSIRITSKFYFGASLAHDTTSYLRMRFARDSALADGNGPRGIGSDCGGTPCGLENPAATELYDVDVRSPLVSTSNLRVNIGLLAKIYREIWLGVAYHTPPGFGIQTDLQGEMVVTKAPRDGGHVVLGGSTVYVSYPASVDFELLAPLPKDWELHVGGRWEDLSRLQAYDVRGYGSVFPAEAIPEWQPRARGLHDAFALWGGAEQRDAGQQWRFGARVGIETSSVDAERTSPAMIAPWSLTGDLGLQVRFRSWVVHGTYGLQYFVPVSVTDSAFDPLDQIRCIESEFDYSTPACASVRNGYAIPTAAGDYSRIQHALRIGFRYELD